MRSYFCAEQNQLKETNEINNFSTLLNFTYQVNNLRSAAWQDF